MKTRLLTAALAVLALATTAAVAKGARRDLALPASELKWVEMMPGGPSTASLWGDRTQGKYAILMKLPAGFSSGPHTHSGDYHGVVIAGTVTNPVEGAADAVALPPASSWFQPGKQPHETRCAAGADCIILITQDTPFDFVPVKATARK